MSHWVPRPVPRSHGRREDLAARGYTAEPPPGAKFAQERSAAELDALNVAFQCACDSSDDLRRLMGAVLVAEEGAVRLLRQRAGVDSLWAPAGPGGGRALWGAGADRATVRRSVEAGEAEVRAVVAAAQAEFRAGGDGLGLLTGS